MGRRGSRVLTRTPRSCRRDPRDFLSGHGARPSLGPPASPLPALRLVGRCTQQPTPSAKSASRVKDAGGRRRTGLCFYFSESLDFTAKFPGRRLDSGVGASHCRSFPFPHPVPKSPASWSHRPGLEASSVLPARDTGAHSAAPPCPPPPRAERGCLFPGRNSPTGALQGDTRCLPRNS